MDGWESEAGQQARVGEHGDPGDADAGGGEVGIPYAR